MRLLVEWKMKVNAFVNTLTYYFFFLNCEFRKNNIKSSAVFHKKKKRFLWSIKYHFPIHFLILCFFFFNKRFFRMRFKPLHLLKYLFTSILIFKRITAFDIKQFFHCALSKLRIYYNEINLAYISILFDRFRGVARVLSIGT